MDDQKTVTIGDKSFDSMWASVRASLPKSPERLPPGKGWLKRAEAAAKLGICLTVFRREAPKLVKSGALEMFVGTTAKATGGAVPQIYYRPKKR